MHGAVSYYRRRHGGCDPDAMAPVSPYSPVRMSHSRPLSSGRLPSPSVAGRRPGRRCGSPTMIVVGPLLRKRDGLVAKSSSRLAAGSTAWGTSDRVTRDVRVFQYLSKKGNRTVGIQRFFCAISRAIRTSKSEPSAPDRPRNGRRHFTSSAVICRLHIPDSQNRETRSAFPAGASGSFGSSRHAHDLRTAK